MKKAIPVWPAGMESDLHIAAGFKTTVDAAGGRSIKISIAAFTMYRLFVNNRYASFGPARCAKGYHRVDELDITNLCTLPVNVIAVEVVGQNSRTYAYADQTSFFCCEILADGDVIRATGCGDDFACGILPERVRKTQRFSFQRAFTESCRFTPGYDAWRRDPGVYLPMQPLAGTAKKMFLPRGSAYPEYEELPVSAVLAAGRVRFGIKPEKYDFNASYLAPNSFGQGDYKMFESEELDFCITDEAQEMRFDPGEKVPEQASEYTLARDSYLLFDMGINAAGMTAFRLYADEDVRLYLLFDEILTDGDIDFLRAGVTNVIRMDFAKGDTYDFCSFEPVGYRYIKVIAAKGSCRVENFRMIEYKHPPVHFGVSIPKDRPRLQKVYDAAVETYRQNALDIFMDCPSRERAGWLCDSFFTARAEYVLTGSSRIEHDFLENFLLPDAFEFLPQGMFPMCYPADHPNGQYIPNWAMWLVCELAEYKNLRGGDHSLCERFQPKIYALLDFFKKYENEFGLLRNLDSWVFIEWSKANELVQEISFPTNMLYAMMLEAVSELYGDRDVMEKANKIREAVRKYSFNGSFFTDNANQIGNMIQSSNEATEVCQYYAFFCRTATPETHPELWKTLVERFGPQRAEQGLYPEIYPANAFIGNYLRMDAMMRWNEEERVLDNIEGYFYEMANTTGTLWEHYDTRASCCHGFASHVVVWLDKIYGKEEINQ